MTDIPTCVARTVALPSVFNSSVCPGSSTHIWSVSRNGICDLTQTFANKHSRKLSKSQPHKLGNFRAIKQNLDYRPSCFPCSPISPIPSQTPSLTNNVSFFLFSHRLVAGNPSNQNAVLWMGKYQTLFGLLGRVYNIRRKKFRLPFWIWTRGGLLENYSI